MSQDTKMTAGHREAILQLGALLDQQQLLQVPDAGTPMSVLADGMRRIRLAMQLVQLYEDILARRPPAKRVRDADHSLTPKNISVHIRTPSGTMLSMSGLHATLTAGGLRALYENVQNLTPGTARLVFNGVQPDSKMTLAAWGVGDGDTVYDVLRLRGDIGEFGPAPSPLSAPGLQEVLQATPLVRPSPPEGDSLRTIRAVLRPEVLPRLCDWTDSRITEQRNRTSLEDAKVDIPLADLRALLTTAVVDGLVQFMGAGARTSAILRRVTAASSQSAPLSIPFHRDHAQRTMQIPLNPASDYSGGKTVFALPGGFVTPDRVPGDAILHTCNVPHCVTPLDRGTRYSLFLLAA